MYRAQPKKQDHGTRGVKWSDSTWLSLGSIRKGMRMSYRWQYRQAKHKFKTELKKISIEASDEEIERYFLKTEFRPQAMWWDFD